MLRTKRGTELSETVEWVADIDGDYSYRFTWNSSAIIVVEVSYGDDYVDHDVIMFMGPVSIDEVRDAVAEWIDSIGQS
jgi:hypothetical protein